MQGTIMSKTLVRLLTGSTLRGRIMAQTAAVLQMVTITVDEEAAAAVAVEEARVEAELEAANQPTVIVRPTLGTAQDFSVLTKAGITNVPTSLIEGDMGTSPITGAAITAFALTAGPGMTYSTSAQVTGRVFGANYGGGTPAKLTLAVNDMETAYTEVANHPNTDRAKKSMAGSIATPTTLTTGVYTWDDDLSIAAHLTLHGSATDMFIFQIAGKLVVASGGVPTGVKVLLTGDVKASNVFWQVRGLVSVGTHAEMVGTILGKTQVIMMTKSKLKGRILAQTAAVLQMVTIEKDEVSPVDIIVVPDPVTLIVLNTASEYAILTKTGITNVDTSRIDGDMGTSPITDAAITSFALVNHGSYFTSPQVTGRVFGPSNTAPTPTLLTTAVSHMETAYTDGAGRTSPQANQDIGAGTIGTKTFTAGVYKWVGAVNIAVDSYIRLEGSNTDVSYNFHIYYSLPLSILAAYVLR
jgi:hypothetical protein